MDDFLCEPICRISLAIQPLTSAIGPAGDMLHIPFLITGGTLGEMDPRSGSITGTDFAVMYADEKLTHHGQFVVAHPAGDIMFSYTGTSEAREGSYDEVIEGQLPGTMSCKLTVQTASTNRDWQSYNRRPLIAVGTFDGLSGRVDLVLLSLP